MNPGTNHKLFSFVTILFAGILFFINGCKKDADSDTIHETGTVTDIDSNVYKTIKIGNQWWMAENLKVKTYRNGKLIKESQNNSEWIDSTASYCLYDNNDLAPGLLYNWYALIDSSNLAPAGWHIPDDDEWKELEIFLGMSQAEADKLSWRGTHEGEKLKIESPKGWTTYETVWSHNESGFTALAGGCRLFDGSWADPGLSATGFWWSATAHEGNEAWYRYLDYKNSKVFRSHTFKNYGMSIRCVKDNKNK